MTRIQWLVVAGLAAAASAPGVEAQQPARRWERPGFDFRPDGVWRAQARAVRARRRAALARGDFDALNAPAAAARLRAAAPEPAVAAAPLAVEGVLDVPVFLVRFRNSGAVISPETYTSALFGSTAPFGRPYTLRTYYEEISTGLLSVQGEVLGWITLDEDDSYYEGGCNGLCAGGSNGGHLQQLLREGVEKAGPGVDFSRFDGNRDGVVDLAVFVHPELGGECGNANIWSHRFYYSGWGGGPLATSSNQRDAEGNPIAGQFVVVDDYVVVGGLGGATSCDAAQLMPLGIIAHETGHGFGLPDLYDTNPRDGDDSEGIGHWGLMAAGSFSSSLSPSYMEGFSRLQLGWVTVRDLAGDDSYELGPYPTADTIFRIAPLPGVANPRGEYFLVENRQGALSDSALIRLAGPGLLIYHVDQEKYDQALAFNQVNTGTIHAVALMQADGLNQLRSSTPGVRNRGDGGDPFPGTSGKAVFSFQTNPGNRLNHEGLPPGFTMDSIRQLAPGGAMAFRLSFGELIVLVNPSLRPAVMGAAYADTLRATGGTGSFNFAPVGGSASLPPGLALSPGGVLSGVPARDSTFAFTVRVTSGGLAVDASVQLTVTAPALAAADVVTQLLRGEDRLTADQLRYLDLLGNRNGRLDVGDVVAWLDRTGVVLDPATAARLISSSGGGARR